MLKTITRLAGYITFVTTRFSSRAKKQFFKSFAYVRQQKKLSSFKLGADILYSFIKHNTTPMEFFTLRFYDKPEKERREFISARTLAKFQASMNHPQHVAVINDKIKFLAHFKDFTHRKWATLEMLQHNQELAENFLNDEKGKMVVKNSRGQSGKQVKIIDTKGLKADDLLTLMQNNNFNLVEEYVVQHDDLMKIAPCGLNTVRMVSQLHNGNAIIISASLRMSIYNNVDNLSMGNIVMPLDLQTGTVTDEGTYLDITKESLSVHPLTKVKIKGFKIPHWEKCMATVKKAALLTPENKSIGWDIAVTNNGPLLIEANENWGYICQITHKRGLKNILSQFVPAPENETSSPAKNVPLTPQLQ
ncbi:MAG: sugar-transfer associated ATP-grasp domain-containing protein [Agriterribacter sp.]